MGEITSEQGRNISKRIKMNCWEIVYYKSLSDSLDNDYNWGYFE